MLITTTQETSTNAGPQRDMCLHCPKHRSADALLCSLLSHCLLQRLSIWSWQRLWKRQFGFKGCLTTWGLIRIYWRSIVIAWAPSIWQRIRYIMQGRSTLISGSTLLGDSWWKWHQVIENSHEGESRWYAYQSSGSEVCTLQRIAPYPSSCVSSVELVSMNYVWLDPVGHGYVSNHNSTANWSRHGVIVCSAQIWEIFIEVENCGERE